MQVAVSRPVRDSRTGRDVGVYVDQNKITTIEALRSHLRMSSLAFRVRVRDIIHYYGEHSCRTNLPCFMPGVSELYVMPYSYHSARFIPSKGRLNIMSCQQLSRSGACYDRSGFFLQSVTGTDGSSSPERFPNNMALRFFLWPCTFFWIVRSILRNASVCI